MKLDSRSVIAASREQVASQLGGETVILGLSAGLYYGVDAVGARIWRLIQEPIVVAAIREAIVAEYEVDRERCEADLLNLLRKMVDARLVEVRG